MPQSPFNSLDGAKAWYGYVLPQYYPDLQFCLMAKQMEKVEKKFRASGEAQSFLRQRRDPGRDPIVGLAQREVFSTIFDLIILAIEDYPPAQLMLVKLSRQKRHLRLTPAYEYFLLARAKINMHTDPDLKALYETAKADLSEKARAALDPLIKSGEWPQDWPLVRD